MLRPRRAAPVLDAIQGITSASVAFYYTSDYLVTTSAGKVSGWGDRSGNAVALAQATGATQPTYTAGGQNGLPYLLFAGGQRLQSAAYSGLNGAAGMGVFVVGAISDTSTAGNNFVTQFLSGTDGTFNFGKGGGSTGFYDFFVVNATPTSVGAGIGAQDLTVLRLYHGIYDGAHVTIYENNVQKAQAAQTGAITTSTRVLSVGANATGGSSLNGSIYAVVGTRGAPNGTDTTAIVNALNAKYSLF